MVEAGQRQLLRAHGAARCVGRLEHDDRAPRLGEADGRGQAIGPAADDDRVDHAASRTASWWSMLWLSTSPRPQNACWASLPASR